jgi:polyisoprenoid-binding protein YceI
MALRSQQIGSGSAAGIAAVALLIAAHASAAFSVTGERAVSFKASGPGGLTIVGNGGDVSIKDQGERLTVVVGLASIKTGIALRDKHMRERYLETAKYPTATLEVERSKIVLPTKGADVDGKLTLHGVTKPVRVHYDAKGSTEKAQVSGSLRINMREFGISVPSYLGVTVKPNVDISIKFEAQDR